MALSSRSQLYPRTASVGTCLAKRQGCCCCWIDALLQQWTRRGPGPQAQIGQAIDVWPCQTSSVTATLAPCGLIGTEPFTRSLSSSVVLRVSPAPHLSPIQASTRITLSFLSSVASKLTSFGDGPLDLMHIQMFNV